MDVRDGEITRFLVEEPRIVRRRENRRALSSVYIASFYVIISIIEHGKLPQPRTMGKLDFSSITFLKRHFQKNREYATFREDLLFQYSPNQIRYRKILRDKNFPSICT